jgi:hypothetical protein
MIIAAARANPELRWSELARQLGVTFDRVKGVLQWNGVGLARRCRKCGVALETRPGPPPEFCPAHHPSARHARRCKWCRAELPITNKTGRPPEYCHDSKPCRLLAEERRRRSRAA